MSGTSDSPGRAISPVLNPAEVDAFVKRLPFAVDRGAFRMFALGFPQRYLTTTPPVEIVRHFALMESLGSRAVISSLSEDADLWKLSIMAKDRSALFARIAGALSCFEMNIVSAEAFANLNAIILDTFRFADPSGRFLAQNERRHFQVFLEDVVVGKADVEAELKKHPAAFKAQQEPLVLEWDEGAHPTATRLAVAGRDSFGLLYRISHAISACGLNIETAFIETPGERVRDEFFLTREGKRLSTEDRGVLSTALAELVLGHP